MTVCIQMSIINAISISAPETAEMHGIEHSASSLAEHTYSCGIITARHSVRAVRGMSDVVTQGHNV